MQILVAWSRGLFDELPSHCRHSGCVQPAVSPKEAISHVGVAGGACGNAHVRHVLTQHTGANPYRYVGVMVGEVSDIVSG